MGDRKRQDWTETILKKMPSNLFYFQNWFSVGCNNIQVLLNAAASVTGTHTCSHSHTRTETEREREREREERDRKLAFFLVNSKKIK